MNIKKIGEKGSKVKVKVDSKNFDNFDSRKDTGKVFYFSKDQISDGRWKKHVSKTVNKAAGEEVVNENDVKFNDE